MHSVQVSAHSRVSAHACTGVNVAAYSGKLLREKLNFRGSVGRAHFVEKLSHNVKLIA